jgi:hypothetical protein
MGKSGFQFNERDEEIVHFAYQLRIATLDHLAALTNRSCKALERRIPKLRERKYLVNLKPRPNKGLYVVGPEGVPVLIKGGYAPEELADKRLRQTEWKDLTIPHALLVASIQTKLLLDARESSMKISEWRHDQPNLWDSVQTAEHGKLPIRPDAYFVVQDAARPAGKNKLHFFLEADVGTMSHTRLSLKVKAYAAYHQQQRHVAKHGICNFQVAIVSQTAARTENLKDELYAGMSAPQRRAYRIISYDELSLAGLVAGPGILSEEARSVRKSA